MAAWAGLLPILQHQFATRSFVGWLVGCVRHSQVSTHLHCTHKSILLFSVANLVENRWLFPDTSTSRVVFWGEISGGGSRGWGWVGGWVDWVLELGFGGWGLGVARALGLGVEGIGGF
ncbi:hypothetical protein M758_4G056800 [Ceratodon purpureus]|nr:hypothetical protein M758_4G056800 [Ceratodon purpureus]